MSLLGGCTTILYDTYPKIKLFNIIIIYYHYYYYYYMQYITISRQLILFICPYAYAPCAFTRLLLFVHASALVVEERDFLLHYFLMLLHRTLTTESLFWLLKSGKTIRFCSSKNPSNKNKQYKSLSTVNLEKRT